jgi:hypothetical protein
MKSWIAFLFGSSLLIVGTTQAQAAVQLATPEQDRYAKQAVPPAGKALIYVYRLDDGNPKVTPGLWLNKRDSGHLEPRTYGMWAAGPGRLEVRAGRADAAPLTITCEAGRIYFVQLVVNADKGVRRASAVRRRRHRARHALYRSGARTRRRRAQAGSPHTSPGSRKKAGSQRDTGGERCPGRQRHQWRNAHCQGRELPAGERFADHSRIITQLFGREHGVQPGSGVWKWPLPGWSCSAQKYTTGNCRLAAGRDNVFLC